MTGKMTGKSSVSNALYLVVILCLCSLFVSFIAFLRIPTQHADAPEFHRGRSASGCGGGGGRLRHAMGLKPLEIREQMGKLLMEMGFTRGAEVGVQKGENSKNLLERWTTCEYFALIDVWAPQENYVDGANVDTSEQLSNMEKAKSNVAPFANRTTTEFFRMTSVEAARQFERESFDFVYLDGRHDYCGVVEDLVAYWPKVRQGGILAGHDFRYAADLETSDWSVCADGSKHAGAVRGAVEEFALRRGLTVSVMFGERKSYSWMVQKPWSDC